MRKKHLCLILMLVLVMILGGCGNKISADKYVGDLITSIKKEDASKLSILLDKGIAESNDEYPIAFPEELKEEYLKFLQTALNEVEFEISGAKETDDSVYSVQLNFTPLDIQASTEDACTTYLQDLAEADLTAAVSAFLDDASKSVSDAPVYADSTKISLEVKQTDKKKGEYELADDQLEKLLSTALVNYMSPYNEICQALSVKDLLQACFDAIFKGDFDHYTAYTGESAASVQAEMEASLYAIPDGLTPEQGEQYVTAIKKMLSATSYQVGIPHKTDASHNYTVTIDYTPNTSFKSTFADIQNMEYPADGDVYGALISIYNRYADAPTFGEPTSADITLNFESLFASGIDNAEFANLISSMLVSE